MELAVLVPVLDRPQNVLPLVRSYLESGCPGQLVFIVEVSDVAERLAIKEAANFHRVTVLEVVDARTWPQKINVGVQTVPADWFLLAADDVEFEPGWWDTTAYFREAFHVIGTNDCANPRVMAGQHSTHTLVSRSYVEAYGTIDEPGKAVHDGYHHWFVDDELLWTARFRGHYGWSADTHIIHHHPYFDPNIPIDDTYLLGESAKADDQALFIERAPMFGVKVEFA